MFKDFGILLLFVSGSLCAIIPLSGDADRSDNSINGHAVTNANVHSISASQKFYDSIPVQGKNHKQDQKALK